VPALWIGRPPKACGLDGRLPPGIHGSATLVRGSINSVTNPGLFEDEDDDEYEDDYNRANALTANRELRTENCELRTARFTKYHSRRGTVVEPLSSTCRC
jgi:hypothetical protein